MVEVAARVLRASTRLCHTPALTAPVSLIAILSCGERWKVNQLSGKNLAVLGAREFTPATAGLLMFRIRAVVGSSSDPPICFR